MRIGAVLLAAGLGKRFGGDKIMAPLDGTALGLHAARTLAGLGLDAYFVVSRPRSLEWPGFTVLINDRPAAGMARSLALGVAAARTAGLDAVLVALADMPFVSVEHYRRLLTRHDEGAPIVASSNGAQPMPPAIFDHAVFEALERIEGDHGARDLIMEAELVQADAGQLRDIDRTTDMSGGLSS